MTNESTLDLLNTRINNEKKTSLPHFDQNRRKSSDYQYKLDRLLIRQEDDEDNLNKSKINIIDSEIMVTRNNTFIENFEFLPLNINSNLNSGQSTKSTNNIVNNRVLPSKQNEEKPEVATLNEQRILSSKSFSNCLQTNDNDVTAIESHNDEAKEKLNVFEKNNENTILNTTTTRKSKENIYLTEIENFNKNTETDQTEKDTKIEENLKETNESSIVEVRLDNTLNEQSAVVKTENEVKRTSVVAKKKKVVKKNFNVEGINNNNSDNLSATTIATANSTRPFSSNSTRIMSARSGSASLAEKVGIDNNAINSSNAKPKNLGVTKKSDNELKPVKTIARKKKVSQI